MKKSTIYTLALMAVCCFASCEDLLEPAKENFKDIEQMQTEPSFAQSFVVNGYRTLPAYYDNSDYATDDAVTNNPSNGFLKMATGSWTSSNNPVNRWSAGYGTIQYLNIFLDQVDTVHFVKNAEVNRLMIRRMRGEAHCLRAIQMYYLLRAHAGYTADKQLLGVLILPGFMTSSSDFNLPRASFQDCVDYIKADLDSAAELLPMTYGDITSAEEIPTKFRNMTTDPDLYNRAMGNVARQLCDGLITEAFRTRLEMLAASPAFQASGNTETWADAANAAARCIDYNGGVSGLSATGLTYYTNTDEISALKEGSNPPEIIWRENVATNNTSQEEDNYPPSLYGNGRMNPTQNLVDAFPMANGYPISDSRSGYDKQNPFSGRDARLTDYIIYDGAKEGPSNTVIRTARTSSTADGIDKTERKSTRTGYYMKKRLNMAVNCNSASKTGQTHYTPRIRFTEMYLDYAEAANEAWGPRGNGTHSYSAYDVIRAIRQRAGICRDTDDPYLEECAQSQDRMRELIRTERRLELCFEGFRFWDLRRWGLSLTETAMGTDITNDGPVSFEVEQRNYKDYMRYCPIPYSETLKYSKLLQNEGW